MTVSQVIEMVAGMLSSGESYVQRKTETASAQSAKLAQYSDGELRAE